VVPCVENAIGNQSFLPSEIIKSHSGKTIEIVDTDAEGRLILADALSYLTKNYTTDYLIDLATLTGSCIGTFGYECAALFSSSDALVQQLKDLGEETGEKVWPLPLWKAYEKEIESDVADVKNYHGKPFAGAIVAAKFLEYFTNDHPKWAHLDIAGTSFTSSEFYSIKHATAFGVYLLLKFAESLIANENGY
jgi:leucyl aminopeptidase